jgi:probable phosphoglycerate mutase
MTRWREVWWIRHAESLGNAGHRTREHGTYSLTDKGFLQARALAQKLERAAGLVVISPYTRAHQTAAPFLERHPGAPTEEWPVQEITFLDPERCVDTTHHERAEMARAFWERWDPDYRDGQGAETFREFTARCTAALTRLRERTETFIAIFTHAMLMRGVLWRALNPRGEIDSAAMRSFHAFGHGMPVPNCAVLPMLLAADGSVWAGGIFEPLAGSEDCGTFEELRLSGL